MRTLLNPKMFFLMGNFLVNMLNGKTLSNIDNEAKVKIENDFEEKTNGYTQFAQSDLICDSVASFGLRSLDLTDGNEYFLELNTPRGCKTFFISVSASGKEFVDIVRNISLSIQNGKFNGAGTDVNKPYENTVWQELPIEAYVGGPDSTPPPLECYGFRMTSKYPSNEKSVFLQDMKNAYYPCIDDFTVKKDHCDIAYGLGSVISAFAGSAIGLCWIAGVILIYQNADVRRDISNQFSRIPTMLHSFLGTNSRRRNSEIEIQLETQHLINRGDQSSPILRNPRGLSPSGSNG